MMIFAGVLLGVIGFFNLLYGIAAVNRSVVFVTDAHYVIWNLRTWGWITMVVGALALLAAIGVLAGNQLARWFGVFVVAVNALNHMFFMAAYPLWSIVVIAVDIFAIYALCVYGGKETMRS